VAEHGLPVLYALFLWWFSTGLILYLDGLPRRSFRWSMLVATGLLGAALYGLVASSDDTSVGGAYAGFTCGLVIWGWHEISFLTGYVTGPRRTPCPEGCAGWQHFVYATQTILHHELAILATAALVVVLTWGEENQVGTWTFVILWGMRLSAKLNVFLGVPNLAEEFLPEHLHYLKSYLAKRPMNLLFPVSVTVATIVAALLVQQATHAEAMAFEAAGLSSHG
jgi:putative photosynthetic complex assembly protein 2